jgi:hypothetical protein
LFGELGEIEAWQGSEHSRETIRVCGLDRESLRRSRERIAEQVY